MEIKYYGGGVIELSHRKGSLLIDPFSGHSLAQTEKD